MDYITWLIQGYGRKPLEPSAPPRRAHPYARAAWTFLLGLALCAATVTGPWFPPLAALRWYITIPIGAVSLYTFSALVVYLIFTGDRLLEKTCETFPQETRFTIGIQIFIFIVWAAPWVYFVPHINELFGA